MRVGLAYIPGVLVGSDSAYAERLLDLRDMRHAYAFKSQSAPIAVQTASHTLRPKAGVVTLVLKDDFEIK
jgi:hypothetical protein